MRWACLVMVMGGLLGGCIGGCPEQDPDVLRSGIYGISAADLLDDPLDARTEPDDAVVVRYDMQAGTLLLTFVDADGGERVAEYTVGDIEVGWY